MSRRRAGTDLGAAVDAAADAAAFSGAVRVDRDGHVELARAYGFADRRWDVPNTTETRFGIASGTKAFTALTVVSLIADGTLERDTTARSLLGDDLPLVGDDVTVEHLLAHRSGIGDYLDESTLGAIDDYVMTVPVHRLATTEDYLAVLGGFPASAAAGAEFRYNNGGYVVLALLAERACGVPFPDLVDQRVGAAAGLAATSFLRSDELPAGTAVGYLERDGLRTNALHLPVRGSGDGGLYSTVGDIHALWSALDAGRIVPPEWAAEMLRPRSDGSERAALRPRLLGPRVA